MNNDKFVTSIEDLEIVREYIRTTVKDIASRKCRMIDKVDNALELLKEQQKEIEECTNEAAAYAELLIKYGYEFT